MKQVSEYMSVKDTCTAASAIERVRPHRSIPDCEVIENLGDAILNKVTPDRMYIAETKGIGRRFCFVGFIQGSTPGMDMQID